MQIVNLQNGERGSWNGTVFEQQNEVRENEQMLSVTAETMV